MQQSSFPDLRSEHETKHEFASVVAAEEGKEEPGDRDFDKVDDKDSDPNRARYLETLQKRMGMNVVDLVASIRSEPRSQVELLRRACMVEAQRKANPTLRPGDIPTSVTAEQVAQDPARYFPVTDLGDSKRLTVATATQVRASRLREKTRDRIEQYLECVANDESVVEFDDVLEDLECMYRERSEAYEENIALQDIYAAATYDERMSKHIPGDDLIQQAYEIIWLFNPQPHFDQEEFIEAIIDVCKPILYGADFERLRPELLERSGTTDFKRVVLLRTGRRFGKSQASVYGCAVLLYLLPDGQRIVLLATNRETAKANLIKVKEAFMQLPGAKERVVLNNSLQFWVRASNEKRPLSVDDAMTMGKLNRIEARAATVAST